MANSTTKLLDGKRIAAEIRSEISLVVQDFVASGGPVPTLAAVLVGDDPASQVYVRNKERACEQAGMSSLLYRLPATTTQIELIQLIDQLNNNASVNGILVQLPLPRRDDCKPNLDERAVLDAVDPLKDVDCFSPVNVGLLMQGRPRFLPCTPHGVVQLLFRSGISTAGKHVVIVGRSDIVGKPLAMILAAKDGSCGSETANATVTLAHSRTRHLGEIVRSADIVIAAVGVPQMITAAMVKPGAVVVDVGINRVGDALVGDVHFDEVLELASAITPVPGGVGPLTIAMLLNNTLLAAKLQLKATTSIAP